MSKDFNWQTDDHNTWEEEPLDSLDAQPSRQARLISWIRKRGRWLAFAAGILFIGGIIAYTLLNRQVEQAEDTTTDDVLTAHALVWQAALDKDFDLLAALMTDADRSWNRMQLGFLNIGLFLGRRPLSLKLLQERGERPVVTLSPDLQTAELTELLPYQITGGEQLSETVWLEQTFFYQRQEESWLLSPLPDDETFWGRWQSLEEGDNLTLVYPRREEASAFFLAEKFGDLVGRICQDDIITCPPNFKLEIRLSRDPTSLQMLNDSILNIFLTPNNGVYHFSLPAPTLAGRPIDDAGYEALFHGYANWLATVMALRYAANGQLAYGQPVEDKLAAWGLEPPPEPQQAMPIPQAVALPPLPFPEQDILLACADFNRFSLLRYDPRTNRWSDDLDGRDTDYLSSQSRQISSPIMASLPDDSGVLLNLAYFGSNEINSKVVSWRSGQERLILERDFILHLLPEPVQRQFDPGGRLMVFFNVTNALTSNGPEMRVTPYAFNLEACLSGNCEAQLYEGFPHWSPDLSWVLLINLEEQNLISLRDERTGEEIPLGNGFSPFWLDDESFIYIRPVEDIEAGTGAIETVQIVTATVDDPLNGTVLLDSAAISNAITGEDPTGTVGISSVVAHPDQPDWLFFSAILAPFAEPQTRHILSFRGDTGEVSELVNLDDSTLTFPFQIMQSGKLLAVQPSGTSSPTNSLILIPLDPEEKTAGPPIATLTLNGAFNSDWSQDGRWLLISGQDSFRLIVPGHNYDQTISHDLGSCTEAVWVNAAD